MTAYDPTVLPDDLPEPVDDGAANHLWDAPLPPFELAATDGSSVRLDRLPGSVVVYAFPRMGRPNEPHLVEDWDMIPGARGCTPESCAFRDHHQDLKDAGASLMFGLSTQDTDYQREAAERLHLPFALLSDVDFEMTKSMRLPTFEAAGLTLLKRFTLVISDGRIEHVFYPVFPPDKHAEEVLGWLRGTTGA